VYALGAILFEILTWLPLHRGTALGELIDSTLTGADARPSVRAPDREVPPELEAVCVTATAQDPAKRFQSVRTLHDAVQGYLEGERDLTLRRQASATHARAAAEAVRNLRAGGGGGSAIESRRKAMQEIGRSLALDPENVDAVTTMVELLSKPPDELPPEVSFEMERQFRRRSRWIGATGASIYAAMFMFLPLLLWMGVKQPFVVATFFVCLATAMLVSMQVMRAKVPPLGAIIVSLLASTVAFAFAARVGSPLILAPTALAINATGYALYLQKRYRLLVTFVACLGFLVPLALEMLGLLPRTFEFIDGEIVVHATSVGLPQLPTTVLIVIGCLAGIFMSSLVVGHIRDQLEDAERRLLLYAWHLREFIPEKARVSTEPTDRLSPDTYATASERAGSRARADR
jgi:serine/threonine-protein kinase